jgi:hypothetical protein
MSLWLLRMLQNLRLCLCIVACKPWLVAITFILEPGCGTAFPWEVCMFVVPASHVIPEPGRGTAFPWEFCMLVFGATDVWVQLS